AAEHWDLTEQIFNSTVVFTGQKQRRTEHKIAGLSFKIKAISPKRFFGISKIWSNNSKIQIADIHKTIVDIVDDPAIGGGGLQMVEIFKAYIHKKEASLETLCKYAEILSHGAVYKRLGFLIEKTKTSQSQWIDKLHSKIKSGIINFDPNGPKRGPIITKWGIRLNVPIEDIA
ncbi:MAG: type IV toxin-antitoxin system AbiEi family antitoxin domain-containing protein, partial [Ginsengibacter sp.]